VRVEASKDDTLVTDQPRRAIGRMRVAALDLEVRLAAGHEESAGFVKAIEALEVEETTIVPNENSVQPTSHVTSRDESQNRSSLQPSLSLANEIRRGTGVQTSTVRTLISEPQGEAARSLVDSGFSGSSSFVAVVQPTDLRHCHD